MRVFIVGALAVTTASIAAFTLEPRGAPLAKDMLVGTTTLDQYGDATIFVPDFITQDDTNFSYQVDGVDAPMHNLYVESELQNGAFVVGGGSPGGEIAWQLVGDRETQSK